MNELEKQLKEAYLEWVIETKEVGREKPITTTMVGHHTRNEIIAFLGLYGPDVESYKISIKTSKKCVRCEKEVEFLLSYEQLIALRNPEKLISDIIKDRNIAEMFLSGLCSDCWDELFKELDENE